MRSLLTIVLLVLAQLCCAAPLRAADVRVVSMTDESVRLVGRWATQNGAVSAAWSASTVEFRVDGATEIAIVARTSNADRVQVEVDGAPTSAVALRKSDAAERYVIASGLKGGPHVVRLVKCTEPNWGYLRIEGIEVSPASAKVSRVERASGRQIEIIGDSISTGYGNEAASEKERYSAATQNAYFTYGAIAARELDADVQCIAWSGRKMWPDFTVPEVYGRVLPFDANSKYDFANWRPQVVVIALGTNDLGKGAPDEEKWTTAYADFIGKLRQRYGGDTLVYVATSPMVSENWPKPDSKSRTVLKRYLERVVALRASAGDPKVKLLEFAQQDGADGLGADWHPSLATHRKMATVLVQAVKADLGWSESPAVREGATASPTSQPTSELPKPGAPDRPIPPGKPTEPAWGCYPNNQPPYTWMDFHRGYVERARQGGIDVVFMGDSLTEFWNREGKDEWTKWFADRRAANFGRGGDTTRQILWRIDAGELDGVSPKIVVLMIGTNNLSNWKDSEDEIAAGVKACVDRIRAKAPEAKVLLLSVPPRWGFEKRIPKLNAKLAEFADGTAVRYLDVAAPLATPTFDTKPEMYTKDRVHLSAEGYRAIADILGPAVEESLNATK